MGDKDLAELAVKDGVVKVQFMTRKEDENAPVFMQKLLILEAKAKEHKFDPVQLHYPYAKRASSLRHNQGPPAVLALAEAPES